MQESQGRKEDEVLSVFKEAIQKIKENTIKQYRGTYTFEVVEVKVVLAVLGDLQKKYDLTPKREKKKPCPMRDTSKCPYSYDACDDWTLFCRILEDSPEHFDKTRKEKAEKLLEATK